MGINSKRNDANGFRGHLEEIILESFLEGLFRRYQFPIFRNSQRGSGEIINKKLHLCR